MGSFDYVKPAKRVTYVNKPSNSPVGLIYPTFVKQYSITGAPAYSTVLSIDGSGAINLAACAASNAGVDTIKFRITIDGNVIYSASWTSANANYGVVGIGLVNGSGTDVAFQRIPFEKSAKFEVSSSASAPLKCYVDYELTQ